MKPSDKTGKPPTDLEHVVLGVIWKTQPTTAHAVRTEFTGSPNHHWSGSAGAIYPAVRRLEERGLLKHTVDTQQDRERRMLSVTRSGLAALRRWMAPPLDDTVLGLHDDPFRTRLFFLGSLNEKTRRAFFQNAIEGLERQLPHLERDRERYLAKGWSESALAVEHTIAMVHAKLAWVRSVLERATNEKRFPR